MKVLMGKDPYIKPIMNDLIDKPIVIRVGDITDAAARDFSKLMTDAHNTGQTIIPVIVDSYGGSVHALFSMISDIVSSRLPVATISVGKSMSAGAGLLAAGTQGLRFIDPLSTVMVHQVSSMEFGKLTELKNEIVEIERLNKLMFVKMAECCGHRDKNYFIKMIDKNKNVDIFLSPQEAKKHKIVDKIGMPELHVHIAQHVQLMV